MGRQPALVDPIAIFTHIFLKRVVGLWYYFNGRHVATSFQAYRIPCSLYDSTAYPIFIFNSVLVLSNSLVRNFASYLDDTQRAVQMCGLSIDVTFLDLSVILLIAFILGVIQLAWLPFGFVLWTIFKVFCFTFSFYANI